MGRNAQIRFVYNFNNINSLCTYMTYSINSIENGNHQKTSINSEIIHELYNAIANKISIESSSTF
ncbi:hypothetical protein H8356DRAFT_1329134 [Neocallimastix lanati (nom. inval.)]|nr:hypothetical protein H8356DRAFT_1329134 [Neocallimastix sp. JGI-2020a]